MTDTLVSGDKCFVSCRWINIKIMFSGSAAWMVSLNWLLHRISPSSLRLVSYSSLCSLIKRLRPCESSSVKLWRKSASLKFCPVRNINRTSPIHIYPYISLLFITSLFQKHTPVWHFCTDLFSGCFVHYCCVFVAVLGIELTRLLDKQGTNLFDIFNPEVLHADVSAARSLIPDHVLQRKVTFLLLARVCRVTSWSRWILVSLTTSWSTSSKRHFSSWVGNLGWNTSFIVRKIGVKFIRMKILAILKFFLIFIFKSPHYNNSFLTVLNQI